MGYLDQTLNLLVALVGGWALHKSYSYYMKTILYEQVRHDLFGPKRVGLGKYLQSSDEELGIERQKGAKSVAQAYTEA